MKNDKKKKQENPSFFTELGVFMKPYKGLYGVSVLISILGVFANLLSYAFVGMIAAALFRGDNVNYFGLAAAAAGGKIIHSVLCNASTLCSHKAAYKTLKDLRLAISEKMLRLPMGYFETNGSGRIKTLLTDRIETIEKPLAHVLPEMTGNLLAPLLLLIWMFTVEWRLALCALIWIIIGFSVTGGMMKNYEEKFAGQINASKTMNQAVTEYVGGIEVIKNFGQADVCGDKYEKAVYSHAAYNVGWQKETQVYSALGMAVAPFSIFPVLIAGLIFYSNGTIDAATLFFEVLLTLGIFGPLMNTMGYFDQLAQMGTIAREIKEILDYPELKRGTGANAVNSDISFKNVTFYYDSASEPALKNISFDVPSGTMFALVGPSGSGKSTIAKLIAGYWDSSKGEIKTGGNSINSYTQEEINKMIAYVDQETFLFDKSIADNIRMGNPSASDEDVKNVAVKAGCDEFISALPNGYDTMAGIAGNRLSGGEKQRIAIARAMMKDAPILILDEATASADPENEALIQSAISAAVKGKTLVVVAHHLSTVMNADKIAFVKDGEIKKTGTHEELLRTFKDYADLWKLSKEG